MGHKERNCRNTKIKLFRSSSACFNVWLSFFLSCPFCFWFKLSNFANRRTFLNAIISAPFLFSAINLNLLNPVNFKVNLVETFNIDDFSSHTTLKIHKMHLNLFQVPQASSGSCKIKMFMTQTRFIDNTSHSAAAE